MTRTAATVTMTMAAMATLAKDTCPICQGRHPLMRALLGVTQTRAARVKATTIGVTTGSTTGGGVARHRPYGRCKWGSVACLFNQMGPIDKAYDAGIGGQPGMRA